jgi:hypothetical protein
MNPVTQPLTRIWWNEEEVKFVSWTEKTLIFHWEDPRETAIHMPRGVVVRLMNKGVLRIEGHIPGWIRPAEPTPAPPASPVAETHRMAQNNSRFNAVARLIRKLSGDTTSVSRS